MIAIPEWMRFWIDWEQERCGQRLTMVAVVDGEVVGELRGYVGNGLTMDDRRREVEREGVEYLVRRYEWQQSRQLRTEDAPLTR